MPYEVGRRSSRQWLHCRPLFVGSVLLWDFLLLLLLNLILLSLSMVFIFSLPIILTFLSLPFLCRWLLAAAAGSTACRSAVTSGGSGVSEGVMDWLTLSESGSSVCRRQQTGNRRFRIPKVCSSS